MFKDFRVILNRGGPAEEPKFQPLDAALSLVLADLKAEFIEVGTGNILYGRMKDSEIFRKYEGLARGLSSFPLEALRERAQRLAFWINVYNAAVIHGVVRFGITSSVREVPFFFKRTAYHIGGHIFSLHEMEHGILRGNRRAPHGLLRPWRGEDPRIAFSVQPLDLRIHFALVCGARSCPPVGFYRAEDIDFQLDLAAASFINSHHVKVFPERGTLLISKIFHWYGADFGGKFGILDTLIKYLDQKEKREFLERERNRILIRFNKYDWNLN